MTAEFVRKLDKSKIPTVKILGLDIAAINMDWLIDYTTKNLKALSGDYMTFCNVHTTVMAYKNPKYKKVQSAGIMAAPDGGPVASEGRRRGKKDMTRTAGPSYMTRILEMSVKKGYTHYFYGSTPETLEIVRTSLERDYPGIVIKGMQSPPFRKMTAEEDAEAMRLINEADADFIWVGLGAPKQEIWMNEHQGKVRGFMLGTGAAFDMIAGNIKRAPEWMQNNNLEWFYRLKEEPFRLFNRYWSTNWSYIWNAVIRKK